MERRPGGMPGSGFVPFPAIAAPQPETRSVHAGLRDGGTTVVVVHHDLSTVRERFEDAVLVRGTVIAHGRTRDVMTDELVARAYLDRPGTAGGRS